MTNISMLFAALVAAMLASLAPERASSQPAADPVLVENSVVKIRKSDYELELTRLPPDIRPGFANSERRVNDLLRRMLIERTMAVEARNEKLDQTPENAAKLAAELDRLHALLKVAKVEADAAAEFDSKQALWEMRAKELYTVDRKRFVTPEQFNASHILFETKSRTRDEAQKLARDARAKVVAGADFNQLAREISEDRTARNNHGRLGWFTAAEMDPAFAAGVAALKSPGDISEPVLSSFGWHLIKLESRRPAVQKTFDEARGEIIAELRQKFVSDQREAWLAKLRSDPTIRAHREAIDALVIRVDPDAVRRTLQQSAPGAMAPPAK